MESVEQNRFVLRRSIEPLRLIVFGTVLVALDFSLALGPVRVDLLPDVLGLVLIAAGCLGLSRLSGGQTFELLTTTAAGVATFWVLAHIASWFFPTFRSKLASAGPILNPVQTLFPLLIADGMQRLARDAEEHNVARSWWLTEQFFAAVWTVPITLVSILGPRFGARLALVWAFLSVILVLGASTLFFLSIRRQQEAVGI